jgi:uncharacterized repeat protein (TIGR01451 family)
VEQSDPALDKRVNPAEAKVGDVVEYILTVSNNGSTPATDVVVEDPLPPFLELVRASASRGVVSTEGATVRVVIGDLAAGENVQIIIAARITQAVAAPQNLNRATLTTSSRTDVISNNTATAAVTVDQPTAPTPTPPAVETATPAPTAAPPSTPVASAEPAPVSNNEQVAQPQAVAKPAAAKPAVAKPTVPQSRPPAILSRTGTNGSQQMPLAFVVFGGGMLVQLLILRRSKR